MDGPGLQVVVADAEGVGVVSVVGAADDAAGVVRLAGQLVELGVDGGHLVLDLSGLRVSDPAVLTSFLARLGAASGGVPVPTVADEELARLLRACGSGAAGLALFASLDEARAPARPATGPPAVPARRVTGTDRSPTGGAGPLPSATTV